MGYRARTHTLVHAVKYVQTLRTHARKAEQESHSALADMHESLDYVTLVKPV